MSLVHPGDAPPEPGYRPSAALADFVRCRDLTCRWPGCDRPATQCHLDHPVPYAQGGPTHASNVKCYCPTHQRLKRLEAGPILDALPDRGPTVGQGRQAETGGSPISDIVDTGPGDCATFVDEVGML